jgi:uncharacterized membrane protein (DUF106 family)
MESDREVLQTLERIRANQERQLEGLRESLELQRQQFEMARTQFERAEKINERAERIQETSASMLGAARKALVVILPVIFFLLVYLTWLIFR